MNKALVIKKVLKYTARFKLLLLVSLLTAIVSSVLTLYIPVLTGKAVDKILAKGQVDFEGLKLILLRIVIFIAISALCSFLMNVVNNRITYGVVKNIRHDAFAKLSELPLSYIDSARSGDILSRIITDTEQFADGLLMGFTQFFTAVITIFGTLIFMLTINAGVAALVVIVTPLSLVVAGFIASKTHAMFEVQSEVRGRQTALINEMLGQSKVVKAFSREAEAIDEFTRINDELEKNSLKAVFFSSITNPCTRFVNGIVYALVALAGGFAALKGYLTVGQLTSFLSYANQYTKPFNEISGVVTELQNSLVCANRVLNLLDEVSVPADKENALVLSKEADKKVDIRNISFSYDKDKKLIENFNLNVKPCQRIAIVGPTGSGKTTIINLLMRFYDVDKGQIVINDVDTRAYSMESLRSNLGMVLQETWLRSGSIYENIGIGKPEATKEEIIEAAKKAHAHSFIKRLPNGYDTVLGENGGILSQGQKQLLCIARVMLALPPILILDEATSSIDTRTEIKISQAFLAMMKGRTSFIVAHRLSTIREADVIIVMNEGRIIEMGNHKELLNRHGFYEKLYNSAIC